jgi:hypothetical protein
LGSSSATTRVEVASCGNEHGRKVGERTESSLHRRRHHAANDGAAFTESQLE